MKKRSLLVVVALMALVIFTGCKAKAPDVGDIEGPVSEFEAVKVENEEIADTENIDWEDDSVDSMEGDVLNTETILSLLGKTRGEVEAALGKADYEGDGEGYFLRYDDHDVVFDYIVEEDIVFGIRFGSGLYGVTKDMGYDDVKKLLGEPLNEMSIGEDGYKYMLSYEKYGTKFSICLDGREGLLSYIGLYMTYNEEEDKYEV